MAYSREEILEALCDPRYVQFGSNPPTLEQTPNYPIIMDYLMGKSNSLQGLVQDYLSYHWQPLWLLLENSTAIGAREKLLFDVAADPALGSFMDWHIKQWLLRYIFQHSTNKALQEALQAFRKLGMNDNEIFAFFIQYLGTEIPGDFEIVKVPFFDFIVNHIKNLPALVMPAQAQYFSHDNWNAIYFMLLAENRPELASQYALTAVNAAVEGVIPLLAKYKAGKYLFTIEQFINSETTNLLGIQRRLQAAIQLFDLGAASCSQILPLAQKTLEILHSTPPKERFETSYQVPEFKGLWMSYIGMGSVAVHYFLKCDREAALRFIEMGIPQKNYFQVNTMKVLHHHFGENAWPYIEKIIVADEGQSAVSNYRSVVDFIQKSFTPAVYLPLVWQLANSKSKSIRELVAKTIAAVDTDAEQKAIALLDSKNAEARITAALILGQTASPAAKEAVSTVLNKEANDNARDLLLQIAADSLPREVDMNFVSSMVDAAQKRGKLNKPVEAWLNESDLPPLYFTNGEKAPLPYVRFLLYRMSRGKEMRSDVEARYVIQHLDKERSAPFAFELISIYKNRGAKPEHKYLMLLAALLGNDSVIDKIRLAINKWIEENRTRMAEHGIGALSLQGGDKALRCVEWYSRKYRSNKAKIGAAALAALENAAEELGITTHELGDRIVPNFDFDGLFKHFTVNGDEYRAFIDSNFKIAFFNEDNKKIKSVPAAADAQLKEEFKAIAKEVRDIVKSQSPRLEYYLIIQRRWVFEKWNQFFLQNPIMFIYATKLLWGVYDEDGKIVQTFLCNDDTTLIDVNHDEISPDETKMIGIVHPSQLSAELLQQWKQVFFDSSVEPIFPQLERVMPDMNGIDLSKKMISKFSGKKMKEGSTRSTLERFGWFRGPVGDGGMLESINLKYPEKKLEAVLEVSGIGVGYGWGGDDTLGRFYVIDTSQNVKQQFTSFQEDDERLVTLESVPGIFLREALAAIEAIKPLEKIT